MFIPVMIVSSPEQAERIVTQVVENVQRTQLTEADVYRLWEIGEWVCSLSADQR